MFMEREAVRTDDDGDIDVEVDVEDRVDRGRVSPDLFCATVPFGLTVAVAAGEAMAGGRTEASNPPSSSRDRISSASLRERRAVSIKPHVFAPAS
jgi:hypothetical protein